MARAGWVSWRGPEAILRAEKASRQAVSETAHALLEIAKQQVPHDEGELMRSGQVFMNPDGSAEASITFGGGQGTGRSRLPYAVRWHENSAKFQKGRKSRYLADPVNSQGPRLLMDALKKNVGGAF